MCDAKYQRRGEHDPFGFGFCLFHCNAFRRQSGLWFRMRRDAALHEMTFVCDVFCSRFIGGRWLFFIVFVSDSKKAVGE
jgi:hypothetical protein